MVMIRLEGVRRNSERAWHYRYASRSKPLSMLRAENDPRRIGQIERIGGMEHTEHIEDMKHTDGIEHVEHIEDVKHTEGIEHVEHIEDIKRTEHIERTDGIEGMPRRHILHMQRRIQSKRHNSHRDAAGTSNQRTYTDRRNEPAEQKLANTLFLEAGLPKAVDDVHDASLDFIYLEYRHDSCNILGDLR